MKSIKQAIHSPANLTATGLTVASILAVALIKALEIGTPFLSAPGLF